MMEFMTAYPMWAKVTVITLIVLQLIISVFAHGKTGEPDVGDAFTITPVEAQGKNIYKRADDVSGLETENFFVKVEFNLWSKFKIELINIDLQYDVPAMFGDKRIALDGKADGKYEQLDGSNRLISRRQIPAASTVNIFASQQFVSRYGRSADYRVVTVAIEFAGENWNGSRVLKASGPLATGGKWQISSVAINKSP
ncbi:MAG: hypothetical protein IPM58_02740 [Nitrospira sp.]|nr:hypothetical protein [Nitrospira sp.]